MTKQTNFTASSREQMDNELLELWNLSTGSADPKTYSAVTYSPADLLVNRYDTENHSIMQDFVEPQTESLIDNDTITQSQVQQSKSTNNDSNEPGFFTKLGNKINQIQSNYYTDLSDGVNPFEVGSPYTNGRVPHLKDIKDATFDFLRTIPQGFVNNNVGNILLERQEKDQLEFQKNYLSNLKNLVSARNKLSQAMISGDQNLIDSATKEWSEYKDIDDALRPTYLAQNKDEFGKYYTDDDVDSRINKINERLTELDKDIATDQTDLQRWQRLLNKVDSIYKPSKEWEQNKQENWLYQVPSGLASSVPSVASSFAVYGAAALAGSAMGSLVGPAGTVAGAALGVTGQIASTIISRNDESLQEVAGRYKSEIYDFLNKNQLPLSVITDNQVRNNLTNLTGVDYSKATDDEVLDAMIAYDVESLNPYINNLMQSAKIGLNDVYQRNMALGVVDYAQTMLMVPGFGKMAGNLLRDINPIPAVKQAIGGYLKTSADWVLKKANAGAAKRASIVGGAKYVVEPVAKTTLNGILEGGEEVVQQIISSNPSEHSDMKWYNPIEGLWLMGENSYAMVKGLLGVMDISWDPALNNNKDIKDSFYVGATIGAITSGPVNIINGVRDLNSYNAGVDLANAIMFENITAKEDVYKYRLYAEKALNNTRREAMMEGIDSQLNDNFIPEGWTKKDVEDEKQNINDIYDIMENNSFVREFRGEDRTIAAALLKHNQDMLDKTVNSYNSLNDPSFLQNLQNAVNKIIQNTEGLNEEHSTLLTNYYLNKYSERALNGYLKQLKSASRIYNNDEMTELYDEMALNLAELQKEKKQIEQALKDEGIDKLVEKIVPHGQVKKIENTFLRNIIAGRAVKQAQKEFQKLSTDRKTMQQAIDKYKQSILDNAQDDVEQQPDEILEDNTPSQDVPEVAATAQPEQEIQTETKSGKKDDDDKKGPIPPAVPPVPPSPSTEPSSSGETKKVNLTDFNTFDPTEDYSDLNEDDLSDNDFYEEPEADTEANTNKPGVTSDESSTDTNSTTEQDTSQQKPEPTKKVNLMGFSTFDPAEAQNYESETEPEKPRQPVTPVAKPVTEPEKVDQTTPQEFVDKIVEGNTRQQTPELDDVRLDEGTVYYLATDTPMLPGYESGNSFNSFSSQPGNISSTQVTARVDKPDSQYGKYNPQDKKTWDNAAIYVEFVAPDGKKYVASLKTIEGAKALKQAKGQQLSTEEENSLRRLRNSIIEAHLTNPNAIITFKHVRMTNGVLNPNRREVTVNGQVYNAAVNRNLQEITGLGLPSDLHGLLDGEIAFAYGEGINNNFSLAILHNDPGKVYELQQTLNGQQHIRGGYGSLFIIPAASSNPSGLQNSVIELNEKRFSEEDNALANLAAQAVLYSRTKQGYDTAPLRQMLIFTDWPRIDENDPRFPLMADKQIKLFEEDGVQKIQLGKEVRPLAQLQNDQGLKEVQDFIKQNSHWAMDKNGLMTPLRNLFTSYFRSHFRGMDINTIPNEIELAPGFTLTLEDLGLRKDPNDWRTPLKPDENNPGYTVLEWMIKNGKIQSDLQDQIYTSPFIYVGEPTIENRPTEPQQRIEAAANDPINPTLSQPSRVDNMENEGSDVAAIVLDTTVFDGSLTPLANGQFRNRSATDDSGLYAYSKTGNTIKYAPKDGKHIKMIKNKEDMLDPFGNYTGKVTDRSKLFTTKPGMATINSDGTITVVEKAEGYMADEPRQPQQPQVSDEVKSQIDELFSMDGLDVSNLGATKISNRNQLSNFKKINTRKAVKWLKSRLGLTDEQITITDGVIREFANGSAVYGICNADCINISNMAIEGVQYHEAWHRVSLLMLTPEMRRNLYEEYRKQHPQYRHVSDQVLEEALADRFMEYMLNDKQSPLRYYINKIFRDILRFIGINRSINPRNLNSIYQAIKYGDFRKYKLNEESIKEFNEAYINNEAYYKVGKNKDYQPNHFPTLADFHTTVNSLKSCLLIANGTKFISDINKLDKSKLLNMLNGIIKNARTTTQQRESIQEIIDHFDDWMHEMQPMLNQLGIREVDSNEENDFIDREETGIQNYDKASYEFSKKDNALGVVKLFLSTVNDTYYSYDTNERGENIKKLHIRKDPITGLPMVLDYDTVATEALKRLSSVETYSPTPGDDPNKSLLGRCASLSREGAIFAALYQRLSNVQDGNLETQILQTIKSANLNPIEVGYTTDRNGVGQFKVIDSTLKGTVRMLPTAWSNVFFNSPLVIQTEEEVKVDKRAIQEIVEQYNQLVKDVFANRASMTDTDVDIYRNGIVELLNQAGIQVDGEAIEELIKGDRKNNLIRLLSSRNRQDVNNLGVIFNNILGDLASNKPNTIQLDQVYTKRRSDHIINQLAYAQTTASPQSTGLGVLGPNNNVFYLKTQNNYCSDTVRRLNEKDANTLNSINNDLYCRTSLIRFAVNNGDPIKLNTFINFYGNNAGDKGREYLKLSPTEDYLMKMTLTWNNHIIFPTMADKKTWNTITGCKLFNKPFAFTEDENGVITVMFDQEVLDYMYSSWQDEFNSIVQYWKTVDNIPKEKRIKNYHTKNKGGMFRHFLGYYENVNGQQTYVDLNKVIQKAIDNGTVLETLENIRQDLFSPERVEATQIKINNNLHLELKNELETAYNLGLINRDPDNAKNLSNNLMDSAVYETVKSWYTSSANPRVRENADRYAVLTMLGNHMVNYNVSKLETEKIFTGDLAFYKNTDDQIKRLGAVLSTGDNLRTQWITNNPNLMPEYRRLQARQTYTCAIFKDNMIPSHQYKEIKDAFTYANTRNLLMEKEGLTEAQVDELMKNPEEAREQYPFIFEFAENQSVKDAEAYGLTDGQGNINQADAAVYIRPQMYQDIVRMLGEWSDEVREAYEILESAEDWLSDPVLYKKSLNTLIKALKTTYFGYRFERDLQHNVPVFNKMAMFPMFKVLATGDNREIYDRMNAVGKYEGLKPIDQIAFESAVKVGIEGEHEFYTDYNNDKINALTNIHTTIQEFRNLRRQLITDPHEHERQMFGTQVSTVAVANLKMDRIYGEGKPVEEQRTGQQLRDQLFGTINAISNKGAFEVQQMFLTDGAIDWSKTSDVLIREARSSNMGKDIEDALQVNDDKDGFKIPLAALPDSKWVESKLVSITNKKAIDIELPGGAFIQMSSFGFKQIGVESSRLLNKRDDGSMDSVISINLFSHVIPDYKNKSFTEAKQWLIKHNLIGDNAKPIAIGYRIPTQGLSSIAGLHIKDVLPSNVGDMIVLPDEFTTQTGSDFDIDKLYIARYNFDKDGNKIPFKGLKDNESFEDYLHRRYIEENGGSFEESDRGYEATLKLYNNWLKQLGNPTNVYEANSREANENLLLDTYMLVLTDKKNVTETRLPLDKVTGIIKNEILPIVDGTTTSREPVPFIEMSPTFQMNKKYEYSGGKTGIGPFALNNKNHVLTQLVNLVFKDNDLLKSLGFTGLNGIKSQNERVAKRDKYGNQVYDKKGVIQEEEEEGLNILDWISAMINAHVDVAKDPYVIRLNVRQYTYNICNFLLRVGFGKNTFYFLPQAILKEMAVAYERADGIYGVRGGSKTSIVNEEIKKIRKSYYDKYVEACRASGIEQYLDLNARGKTILRNGQKLEDLSPSLMSRDELIDNLQSGQNIDNSDNKNKAEYYYKQLVYSELFLQLNDLAQDMSKLVQLSQIDTKRFGGNFIEQDRFMYRLKSFLVNQQLFKREDVEKYFSNTFLLTKTINGIIMPSTIFQDIMLRSKQSFKNAVTKVLTLVRMDNVNDEALNKTIANELEGQIRWQFLNNVEGFDLYDMLYGPNSMSYRLANIKKDIIAGKYPEMRTVDGKIANKLLNHLTSLARFTTDNYNAPSIIATNNVDESDKFLKQDLKFYWQELLESPHEEIRKFATDLIYYQLATTAGNFTKNGMWNIMPTEAIVNSGYASFIDKAVKDFTEADLNYDNFFLNNWQNGKLVPTVETKIQYFDEEMGEIGTKDAFDMMYGNIRINGTIRNVPIILNPYRSSVGTNRAKEPIFSPYVKVVVDRTTPEGVLLYKYVGYTLDSRGIKKPLYVITNKKGLNNSGRVVKEYDEYSNSVLSFNNINPVTRKVVKEGEKQPLYALPGNRQLHLEDIIEVITNTDNATDKNKWLNEIKGNFNLVPDYIPSTQAIEINMLTLGLNTSQTETYNEPATEHGDNIEVTEQVGSQFKFKDGFTVQLPFKLNQQQVKALLILEDYINNPRKYSNVVTLTGYAGTGKSTLIGIFDQYLRHKGVKPKYSAPTHRANAVTMMNNPNAQVATLHSLFGLRPTLDLTDGKYDLRNLKNQQVNKPGLKDGDILIIDESSMISKALYKFIEDFKNNHNVKIIYVGDDAQLSPVNDDSISPVFTGNQTKIQLTKVERTGDNAILAESTRLRNGEDFSYETRDNVEFTNSSDRANEVIDSIVNSQEFKENPLYFRILSATNDMIQNANERVRRILFGDNAKQIEIGDIMMGYNNIVNAYDQFKRTLISNSIDYTVTEVGEKESKTVKGVKVSGYNVTLKEANSDKESKIFVLDNTLSDDTLQKLADAYKSINLAIDDAFVRHEYDKLQPLFEDKSLFEQQTILMREFKDKTGRLLLRKSLDYGYAHTIHKSQGGTYNNVLIYADTIDRFNDPQVRQQLKYVAMSRAKDNVIVLTSHPTTDSREKQTATNNIAEEWSKKEGWSVNYFNRKVLPKLDSAWQIEYQVVPDQTMEMSNVQQANMNYDYGTDKRSDVTAESTLQAIKNGERTATTRYEEDQHIDFWKSFKTDDYLRFVKKDKNGNIVDSVLVQITKPAAKLAQSTTKSVESVISTNPKDYKLYSGGAIGSDTEWANVAKQYGIGRTINYRPETLSILTTEQIQEVETQYTAAANRLGRKILDANSYAGKLVRRDYLQAKAADEIFAIGHILSHGSKNSKGYTVNSVIPSVDGGTGYAVQMAIDLHKPVHVYDQIYKQWYKFDYNDNTFVAEDTPTLTPNFAGIGTREITEYGKKAIRDIFAKTFGEQQVQQITEQSSGINIYYSAGENADLSNFAIRPFNFKNMHFQSVEQAFQYYKWAYSSNDRQNEIIANKILLETSGGNLRALGKQFKGLDTKAWDESRFKIMKKLIKASFEQNDDAKQRLLATGNITLTHNQELSIWKTEFPRILMEVRDELKRAVQQSTQKQTDKTTKSTISLTSFSTFDESEIQSNSDVEQMNRDGEQIKKECKGE